MMPDLEKAKTVLKNGDYTCVFCNGETVYTHHERGVTPLLQKLDGGTDVRGFCAADKVVGGAVAFLYVLLGIKALHALVVSERALAILRANGIAVTFDTAVAAIKNRAGDGFCPMEAATAHISVTDPALALIAIRQKREMLIRQE